jgi:hypothetical protein
MTVLEAARNSAERRLEFDSEAWGCRLSAYDRKIDFGNIPIQ